MGSEAEVMGRQQDSAHELLSEITPEMARRIDEIAGLGKSMIALRQSAVTRLGNLRFPSPQDELWRQTKPELFPFGDLMLTARAHVGVGEFSSSVSDAASKLPEGVKWVEGFDSSPQLLHEALETCGAELADDAVAQLMLASVSGGGVLTIRQGAVVREPLRLSQLVDVGASAACPLVIVVVEAGAHATLIEDISWAGFEGFYAPRVEVLVRPNASFEFVSVQRLEAEADYLARHRFHLFRDAQVRAVHIAMGSSVSRLDLDCKLYEPGASADLYSLYLARGDSHCDLHTTQWHIAPHCRSNLYCKGVAADTARAVYYGYIRVAEQAQKTDAYQKNRNLLLSSEARADAVPNLEIRANDVKCSHGASVGQVGADELFYLMSRGISRAAAQQLLVEAFFEDLVARITNKFVREFVEKIVMERVRG